MADQLDHALRCPSRNVFDCEHFQTALDEALPAAASPALRVRRAGGRP